jgi:hypothetical protein
MAPKATSSECKIHALNTHLLLDGMNSDAIAHINAEAAFKPPPHSRKIEDSQTNWRENTLG